MQKVAVTGASGHIGNCLVRELIKKGAKVKVLIHNDENDLERLGADLVYGDILNPESLAPLCKDVEIVYHCAARISINNRHRKEVFEINVTGTKNMLHAAKEAGVKRFIHFSSIDAFQRIGKNTEVTEETPLTTSRKSMYEYSKAEGEKLAVEASRNGMDVIVLSPTAVIGPYDYRGSFLGEALKKIYRNKIPLMISGGYDWVDVRDVVKSAVSAADVGRNGEKYILSGHFSTLMELSALIAKISGRKPPRFAVPVFLAFIACPFFELADRITGHKPVFTCNSLKLLVYGPRKISKVKAQKELGHSARPLDETLKDTFNWYSSNLSNL